MTQHLSKTYEVQNLPCSWHKDLKILLKMQIVFISLKYVIGTYKAREKLSIKNIFYWLNNGYIYLRQ